MTKPVCKQISSGHIKLLEPWVTSRGETIPAGYVWDGMTCANLIGVEKFGDRVNAASLEHDHDYVHHGRFETYSITRYESDLRLIENLKELSPAEKRRVWIGVRIFGGLLWPESK